MSQKYTICKRLKGARLAAGLSQRKLGIAAGIDEFTASARMNQYETGKHMPDFFVLSKIAGILKIPASYFYTSDEILAEIIYIWDTLDEEKKLQLLNIAKSMVATA